MDVSTAVVHGDVPLQPDVGLLACTDASALDMKQYKKDREALLASRARNATQMLVNAIFQLPITRHPEVGPLATLPAFVTPLPREKPLPKPKPLTKWEKFARKKGIANKKKERLVYDEATQQWVPRWGFGGKNKEIENQWLVEVPNNADDDFRPDKDAQRKRKDARLKNEAQRLRNLARNAPEAAAETRSTGPARSALGSGIAPRAQRRANLEAQLHRAQASTASMGRFDKKLDGEAKPRGQKRTFQPNEIDTGRERASNLALLAKIGDGRGDVNLRKAIKYASGSQGSKALAQKGEQRAAKRKR
ncbi:Rhodanese- sulfurtransferase [Malassezia cuniculi]|uniref:Ribosome biogenesis regulatory protein n=1 Tax=Malassezia cuniculi TaxID=948313 RepID=A0AAF0ERZ6_9BASI|nr:Rhodanese- sulfurtransferase [Malassezia cuniculi]